MYYPIETLMEKEEIKSSKGKWQKDTSSISWVRNDRYALYGLFPYPLHIQETQSYHGSSEHNPNKQYEAIM